VKKIILSAFVILTHGLFLFIGVMITKDKSVLVTRCNRQLHKMQSYYLDNVYVKFGVKEAKDERSNIKAYCEFK
jgi:hypothetical protein